MESKVRGIPAPREMRSVSEGWRAAGEKVGLVPTMGALHDGHLSLVERAREECDRVIVSLFVNPTQFGEGEDFDTYPRDFERDKTLLAEAGCDAIFAPGVEEMYGGTDTDLSSGRRAFVEVGELGKMWEGKHRPGHFRGVATVVTMLMAATTPHRAYFGEKDYQQLKIIQKMVRDLLIGVEIVGCPTVREKDGLAMSSRNANLSAEEREAASALPRALFTSMDLVGNGERDTATLVRAMQQTCETQPLVSLQYAAVVDSESLSPIESIEGRAARALIAAHVGGTHLIDNMALSRDPLAG